MTTPCCAIGGRVHLSLRCADSVPLEDSLIQSGEHLASVRAARLFNFSFCWRDLVRGALATSKQLSARP